MTTNASATIYNLVQTKGGDVIAYRHGLASVHWYGKPGTTSDGNGTKEACSFFCRIPDPDGYLPPKAWEAMSDKDRLKFWTVRPGDVLVKGDTGLDLFDEDGHRLEDLQSLFEEVCTVRFAHDNTDSNAPHIYAGGV